MHIRTVGRPGTAGHLRCAGCGLVEGHEVSVGDPGRVADGNDREGCWRRAQELHDAGMADVLEAMLSEGWSPPLAIGAVMRRRRRDGEGPPAVPWRRLEDR